QLFDLIIKGSVKEAKKILIELSEKFQESHETRYLKGLECVLESVREPRRVIEAIDELVNQQYEIGRFFTEEEAKALGDLRCHYFKLEYECRELWKHTKNNKTKAKSSFFFFAHFLDFLEVFADTNFFILQESNFFYTLFPFII
ncbi:MAG: hypothetical protein NWF08_01820, partial [Candidatus Bathyarchaeota archaeon]|nr:hypothetical protein [Candidatus Bathyarchaeota archaeon]